MSNAQRKGGSGRDPGEKVPACKDCNCRILGARLIPTVGDRGAYVLGALRARLAKESPEVSEEELREYGPLLRSALRSANAQRRRLIARISYAEHLYG